MYICLVILWSRSLNLISLLPCIDEADDLFVIRTNCFVMSGLVQTCVSYPSIDSCLSCYLMIIHVRFCSIELIKDVFRTKLLNSYPSSVYCLPSAEEILRQCLVFFLLHQRGSNSYLLWSARAQHYIMLNPDVQQRYTPNPSKISWQMSI